MLTSHSFAEKAHSGCPTHATIRKSLSSAKPFVGTAQEAKKSRASSNVSWLCQVVITTSLSFGLTNFRSSKSASAMHSSTMSWNLSQPFPQAQRYTTPVLNAAIAKSEILPTGSCDVSAATNKQNRLVGGVSDAAHSSVRRSDTMNCFWLATVEEYSDVIGLILTYPATTVQPCVYR